MRVPTQSSSAARARALVAFLALPGMVAYALPLAMAVSTMRPARYAVPAALLGMLGTLLLLWCVREFHAMGRGTLAPWDPPQRLVTSGPYRLSRNPMYVAVVTVLAGWCTASDSRALFIYGVAALCAVALRVVLVEEPWAARRFGAEWDAYRTRVPRWLL